MKTTVERRTKKAYPVRMRIEELAQIIVDVRTLPQKKLRQYEDDNLVSLLLVLGRERVGDHFDRLVARKFLGEPPVLPPERAISLCDSAAVQ